MHWHVMWRACACRYMLQPFTNVILNRLRDGLLCLHVCHVSKRSRFCMHTCSVLLPAAGFRRVHVLGRLLRPH